MKFTDKKSISSNTDMVQENNKRWWTDHTMSYDWKSKSRFCKYSEPWFEDIDLRMLHGARLFSDAANTYEELMVTNELPGQRVLEIGCGMGFHSEMLARAGAELSAIDLSPTSVTATMKRFELKQLSANVRQMDAEDLDFPSGSFDMVWSWGVIHHSSRTGRIVREIERVLRPSGKARIMVYNLEGMPAYITFATRYLLGFWRGKSLDEMLWQSTDGFSARYYSRDSLTDLLATFFDHIEITVLGQDADAVPLPRGLRHHALRLVSLSRQRALVRQRGGFLFAVAEKAA